MTCTCTKCEEKRKTIDSLADKLLLEAERSMALRWLAKKRAQRVRELVAEGCFLREQVSYLADEKSKLRDQVLTCEQKVREIGAERDRLKDEVSALRLALAARGASRKGASELSEARGELLMDFCRVAHPNWPKEDCQVAVDCLVTAAQIEIRNRKTS